jgi:tetratricopeptide (TPR) repeat protein
MCRTVVRIADWRSNQALWAHELKVNPNNQRAYVELAVEANHAGDYRQAESLAAHVLSGGRYDPLAQLQLNKSLLMQKRYDDAFAGYKLLLEKGGLHPHHLSDAWFDLGYLNERIMNKLQDAVTAYSNALSVNPYNLAASLNLGRLHVVNGDLKSAQAVWKDAIKIFPDNSDLRDNLKVTEQMIATGMSLPSHP